MLISVERITLNTPYICYHKIEKEPAHQDKAPIQKSNAMQKYNLVDFTGDYKRNSVSPNTFCSESLDRSVILRVRTNPQVHQTKYYLVYRVGKGRSHYLSALWNSTNTSENGLSQYIITDTQGQRGVVEIDMFTLSIKKP